MYDTGSAISIVRPDFIFFARQSDGSIAVDIVDPHGLQFADALPRLAGLARYAAKHSTVYRRIEVVAQIGGKFRAIDLTEASVRKAVVDATAAKELFEGSAAVDYVI